MIYQTPMTAAGALEELDVLTDTLARRAGTGIPVVARLRRQARASAYSSSTSIEGYRVPEDAEALANREVEGRIDDSDRAALSCYALAMSHVGILARDPRFRWLDRVLLDLHFEACSFQSDKDPGLFREGGMQVTRADRAPYRAPPGQQVAGLIDELLVGLGRAGGQHVVVRAAMAHLNLVSIHPFRDGNGRLARILQSLVLARSGPLPPELGSIEPFLARRTDRYYAALIAVQGDEWDPTRDATSWVDFCIEAHVAEARDRIQRLDDAARRWSVLEALVRDRGWPDRLVIALEQSLFAPVTRRSYAAETGVSETTASQDLRRLSDAGWLGSEGLGRNVRYTPTQALRDLVA